MKPMDVRYRWRYRLAARLEEAFNRSLLIPAWAIRIAFARQGRIRKVLISRLDSIGDLVLFTASLPSLRAAFPGSKLVLLVRESIADLVHGCTDIDEIWSFDVRNFRRNLVERLRWFWRMSSSHFDIAINPVFSTNFSFLDCLVGWTLASRRIAQRSHHRSKTNLWYNELVPAKPDSNFEIERNNDLCFYLGSPTVEMRTRIWIGEDELMKARQLTNMWEDVPYAILAPQSLNKLKIWPSENFVEVIQRVTVDATDLHWLLTGSKDERESCNVIERELQAKGISVTNLCGETSLRLLAALAKGAVLCLGNDSALMHLAAAQSVPCVCILGGGHPGRFFPYPGNPLTVAVTHVLPCYGCDWKCTQDKPTCILSVTVAQVETVLRNILRERTMKEHT